MPQLRSHGTPWHAMMLCGWPSGRWGPTVAMGLVLLMVCRVQTELLRRTTRERLLGACAHVDRLPLPLDVKGSDDAEAARESTATAFAEGGALCLHGHFIHRICSVVMLICGCRAAASCIAHARAVGFI